MDIPIRKIVIYALTFLAYAWSGYGSGILSNLRDAVLAAEGFFGNFAQNAVDIIKSLNEVHRILNASEENCKFTCPRGEFPVKNKYHKPTANGCGTDLLQIKLTEYLPVSEMVECCNEHDICYDTCNNLKKDCDDDFKTCLSKICDNKIKVEALNKACKVAASMIKGSMTLGCKSYLESQKRSCYCSSDQKKKKYTAGNEL